MTGFERARAPIRSIDAEAAVLTKAVLRTAERLGVNNADIGRVLGISASSVSRMTAGTYVLSLTGKEFELAALLVRLYRGLDAIVGGDDEAGRSWLRTANTAVGGVPLAMIQTVAGLNRVLMYVDAQRARL